MSGEPLVNGEARQGVAVLTQRINDCQAASARRWDQHDRIHACMAHQLADVERGIHEINLTLAAEVADVRKAELDHSSKIWVAVVGAIVVAINVAAQIVIALIR